MKRLWSCIAVLLLLLLPLCGQSGHVHAFVSVGPSLRAPDGANLIPDRVIPTAVRAECRTFVKVFEDLPLSLPSAPPGDPDGRPAAVSMLPKPQYAVLPPVPGPARAPPDCASGAIRTSAHTPIL
jgi:hypothetical protein